MRPLARLLLAPLVFVFAAATVVQATVAMGMQTNALMSMTMPGPASDPMPGGDDCSDASDDAIACFAACTLPALGLVAPAVAFVPMARVALQPLLAWAIISQSRPPDPYPPRPSVLN
jgi:hypothetical protein